MPRTVRSNVFCFFLHLSLKRGQHQSRRIICFLEPALLSVLLLIVHIPESFLLPLPPSLFFFSTALNMTRFLESSLKSSWGKKEKKKHHSQQKCINCQSKKTPLDIVQRHTQAYCIQIIIVQKKHLRCSFYLFIHTPIKKIRKL